MYQEELGTKRSGGESPVVCTVCHLCRELLSEPRIIQIYWLVSGHSKPKDQTHVFFPQHWAEQS